jgi:hypothetical protein
MLRKNRQCIELVTHEAAGVREHAPPRAMMLIAPLSGPSRFLLPGSRLIGFLKQVATMIWKPCKIVSGLVL